MRISLGRGIGKWVTIGSYTKVTLYRIVRKNSPGPWETPRELLDYIQSLFGPSVKFID